LNKVQPTANGARASRIPLLAAGAVTGIGSLPFTSATAAIRSVAEVSPEVPFWPQLPQLSEPEGIVGQGLAVVQDLIEPRNEGYGYKVKDGRLNSVLEILHRSTGELTPANAAGFGAFEEALSSGLFTSAIAVKGQIEGPITLSAYLFHKGRPFLSDPALFAAIAFHVSQIIGWQIDRLKSAGLPCCCLLMNQHCAWTRRSRMLCQRRSGSTRWRPRWRTLEFEEPTPDCTAAQRVPSSACGGRNRTLFRSMLTRDLTCFSLIGMGRTSCNTVERLPME
jgi:hypothetical protein